MVNRLEWVFDNSLNPTQNIWNGTRYKIYLDVMVPETNSKNTTFNLGYDYRHYVKIYRNFIWAGRAAGDASWGTQKIMYYLGGVDGWINPQFNSLAPSSGNYAYQSLTINMRGYNQNIANGNNAIVFNRISSSYNFLIWEQPGVEVSVQYNDLIFLMVPKAIPIL